MLKEYLLSEFVYLNAEIVLIISCYEEVKFRFPIQGGEVHSIIRVWSNYVPFADAFPCDLHAGRSYFSSKWTHDI